MTTKKKDVIETLEELIRIDSRNPFLIKKKNINDVSSWRFDGNELRIARFLFKRLEKAGFSVKKQYVHTGVSGKQFYNILAEKGKGKKSLLFYGHMDTVGASPWLSLEQALTPELGFMNINGKRKEVVKGLGSNDMKAGLSVLLSAFSEIEPEEYKLKIAFGVDEEFYSLGANALVKSNFLDDVAAVFIPEISDGPNQSFGPSTIGLGRLGRCEFIINVPGTGGHGAESGSSHQVNALVECSKIVCELENFRKNHSDRLSFVIGRIPPGETNSIKGTLYPSLISSGEGTLTVPSQGEITVDWTFTPNIRISDALCMLRELIQKMYNCGKLEKTMISGEFQKVTVEKKLRPTPYSDGYLVSNDHPLVRYTRNILDLSVGFRNYNMGYSVADENVLRRAKNKLPILVIGPVGGNTHRADEWVCVDSVRNLEKVYRDLAQNFGQFLEKD